MEVKESLASASAYARTTLLTPAGHTRGEYDLLGGVWRTYEPAWHTGQLIWGLLESRRVTGDDADLAAARRAGDWWASLQYTDPGPLRGFLRAEHGAEVGSLINFTTIADGAPGLFALSRATGDDHYADVATAAGAWGAEHLYVPEHGVIYDLINSTTGAVLDTDDPSPHFADDYELSLFDVTRPNNEGFLYYDMFKHTGDSAYLEVFRGLSDALVRYQDTVSGFWMDFHPNSVAKNKVHARSNTWYAESLLRAYEAFGDEKYLRSALRLARAVADWQTREGGVYYGQRYRGAPDRRSLSGSAAAFAGILWLELSRLGYPEFDERIHRTACWLIANQFPADHPDPNVRGGYLETWRKNDARERLWVRDIATAFGLRFLARYHGWLPS